MEIPDNQRIAIFWNDKPIGLVVNKFTKPKMFAGKIITMYWEGECLGESIADGSPNEIYRRARTIAHKYGLRHIYLGDGTKVTTLYTPPYEE